MPMTDPEAVIARAKELLLRGEAGLSAADAAVAKTILVRHSRTDAQLRTLEKIVSRYGSLEGAPRALTPIQARTVPALEVTKRWNPDMAVRLVPVKTKYGDQVGILTGYQAKDVIEIVKGIPGRIFDKTGEQGGVKNAWIIPAAEAEAALRKLRTVEPKYKVEVDMFVEDLIGKKRIAYAESRAASSDFDVSTKLPLRPFQRAGVKGILDRGGRALIADDPGLGKTPQALGYLLLDPKKTLPALVVCPANLRPTWYQETGKFTDLRPLLLSGTTALPGFRKLGFEVETGPIPGFDVAIMNYDLFDVETPKTWISRILRGVDVDACVRELVSAGHQATKPLLAAMKKAPGIEVRNALNRAVLGIQDLGKGARPLKSAPYRKATANGFPIAEFLAKGGWQTLILDECHALKDGKSQRAMACEEISGAMASVVGLTGTPVLNRVMDLYQQVRTVNPTVFPNFFDYGIRYCGGHKKSVPVPKAQRRSPDEIEREVWDFSGSSNLTELEEKLRSTVMIRREKSQVLSELPPKTRVLIPLVIENPALERKYKKETKAPLEALAELRRAKEEWKALMASMAEDERRAYMAQHAEEAAKAAKISADMLGSIEEVKQACARAKMDQAVKFVLNLREQVEKQLVFASHHETLSHLEAEFREAGARVERIDGRVDMAKRPPIIDRFQKGDTEILVCGIRAVSEGLTLTAAYTSSFVELDWNPARHHQAEDRIHRISQSMPVTIYYLVIIGSLEEKIAKMIDGKREIANAVLGEEHRTVEEAGILDSLISEAI